MSISPTRKFRHAVGSLDNDSDPEIDVSAVSTSCGMSITGYAFPSKRQKMNHTGEQVAKSSPSVVSNIVPLEATAVNDQTSGEAKPFEEAERNQVRLSWYFEVAE